MIKLHSRCRRSLLILCLLGWLVSRAVSTRAVAFPDAIAKGDLTAVQRMLQATPQLAKTADADGSTPLHLAATKGHVEIARVLLNYGADVNARGSRPDRWTPLFCAADNGQFDMARYLTESGADVTARAHDGFTPLEQAVWRGNLPIMRLLLDHHADLASRNSYGDAALHDAARSGQTGALAFLVARGMDLDMPNKDGNTPLAVAAWYNQPGVGRFLLAAGADFGHKNRDGHTAMEEALRAHNTAFANMMARYLIGLDERNSRAAVSRGFSERIRTSAAAWTNPHAQTQTVYKNDFQAGVLGPEWMLAQIGEEYAPLHTSATAQGVGHYLGDFGNQTVRLVLDHLPPHQEISVSFDLFILRAWQGNAGENGPHLWTLRLVEGPTLLSTTFANYLPFPTPDLKVQAYPGSYPGDHHPLQTQAEEKNIFGATLRVEGQNIDMDALYKLRFTFPHANASLMLDFAASGLPKITEASWGLAHVEVSVPASGSAGSGAGAPAPSGKGRKKPTTR